MSRKLGSGVGLAVNPSSNLPYLRSSAERANWKRKADNDRKVIYDYLTAVLPLQEEGSLSERVIYFPYQRLVSFVQNVSLSEEKQSRLERELRGIEQHSLVRGYVPREQFARLLDRTECLAAVVSYCRNQQKK